MSDMHARAPVSRIKCPVYRYVKLGPLCRAFVDLPAVQRLRHIKQLGFVHYVYPSAVHTRFEHSLGVMHLAGLVVDTLNEQVDLVTPREKELVQLAGLLHDTGHVAFSHLLDDIMVEQGLPPHEERSVQILREANAHLGLLDPGEEQMVATMITGAYQEGCGKPYLYQIVANHVNGVDVDRMDYLARDSLHTGMPGFQCDYLIASMAVRDGNIVLRSKAEPDLRLMFAARQRLFHTVYRHRTIVNMEAHIVRILKDLMPFDVPWTQVDDVWLTYHMRCHALGGTLDQRSWKRQPATNRFQHCTLVDNEAIEAEVAKVVLI
jgi:HD superfamily phosphohydrolase